MGHESHPEDAPLDFYAALCVNSNASSTEITKAYRRLALRLHPDKNPTAHVEQFQAICTAYEVLSDPEKRRLYDAYGPSLRPSLQMLTSTLAPVFVCFVTGCSGAIVYHFQWIQSLKWCVALQVISVGAVGRLVFFGNQHHRTPNPSSLSSNSNPKPKNSPRPTPMAVDDDFVEVTTHCCQQDHCTNQQCHTGAEDTTDPNGPHTKGQTNDTSRKKSKPKQLQMSKSDYVTIACVGLVVGNLVGFSCTSMWQLWRSAWGARVST